VSDLESGTMRQISLRLLPLVFLLYVFSQIDRSNVSIAALQMNEDLKFSSAAFGLGAGIFYLGYALFEIPSNLLLARVGARRWLARIAVTWGLVSCAMMWIRTPGEFYLMRFALGVAEAGLFPGVIYYLGQWFPAVYRARALSFFLVAIPLAHTLSGSVGGLLLGLHSAHLSGWQCLFLIEGLPPVLLGVLTLRYLTDKPEEARWLSIQQRSWLIDRLTRERPQSASTPASAGQLLAHPLVWGLVAVSFVFWTVSQSYTYWAPTLVRDTLHTSNSATAMVVAGISLLTVLFYPLAATISDRRDERCAVAAFGFVMAGVGCLGVALLPHSPLRLVALFALVAINPLYLSSFWCLPAKFLKGTPAAAGIALINGLGSTGGFFGPSIIGFLRQTTGSDAGGFVGIASLALIGALGLVALRQLTLLRPRQTAANAAPA